MACHLTRRLLHIRVSRLGQFKTGVQLPLPADEIVMKIKFVAILLLFAITSAQAQSPSPASLPAVCRLLQVADIQALGIAEHAAPQANVMELSAEQTGAPGSIHAELCFFYAGQQGSRHSLGVTVETYERTDGLADWLNSQNQKSGDKNSVLTQFGDTTCEQGRYPFQSANASSQPLTQHYVSCDRLTGNQRLSLIVETPDSPKPLPTAQRLSDLLNTLLATHTGH